jgi:hypothetical protein
MRECCENIKDINIMTEGFLSSSIKVIIEKECGYSFLIYLNEFSTIIDLYRYVEQFYQHCNENKILYEDKARTEIIYKTDIQLKEFINIKTIKPNINLENSYIFYLNLV